MTNSFTLNHDKSLQIYFFCVKSQVKTDFLKDVESTEVTCLIHSPGMTLIDINSTVSDL